MKLEIGDTVRLKSGGPVMTIKKFIPEEFGNGLEMVECNWFDNNEKRTDSFHIKQLKSAKSGPTIAVIGGGRQNRL